jgi:diguanylate cyclase (GGDEF)-like protein
MLGHKVARKIVEFVRSSDVVGRLGDEIGVLLLQAASGEALKVSERLLREIGSVRFLTGDAGPGQSITLNVGAASFPGDGTSDASLVSRARARLEEAVRSGGERIVKADDT